MTDAQPTRILLALPQAPLTRWRAALLADLRARGFCPVLVALPPGSAAHDLPQPVRAFHALHRFLGRNSRDPLAPAAPDSNFPADDSAWHRLDQVDPRDFALMVWAGQGEPLPAPVLELARRLPLGLLALEPPAPAGLFPGVVPGRLLWLRGHEPARLALTTTTCLRGPFAGSFVREHFAKAALMPGRALARLLPDPEAFWSACPRAEPADARHGPLRAWLGAGLALAVCVLERAWQDLACTRQWFLAERPATGGPSAPDFATRPFAPVPLPGGVGQADPFVFVHQGRTWCFLEEILPNGRGVIAVRERQADGSWSPSRRVLEEPFHLSYPFVFAHEGQVWMLPETGQAGRVGLYRATDFPGGWTFERELLSGLTAVDATLFEHEGRHWMFVTVRPEGGSSWDELHLYHAPHPFGPYTPHPENPVVSDVRRARPAGRVFRHQGRIFRPGQDSSRWYGRGLALMEITRLDLEGYAERPTARLDASLIPGSFCLHTYQAGEGFEVVDGQRFLPFWRRRSG